MSDTEASAVRQDLPPLDLSLLARVSGETRTDDAPILPPNAPIDSDEPSRRRGRAAGRGRTGETRAQREQAARERGSTGPSGDKPQPLHYRPGIFVKPLSNLYTTVGTLVAPFNQPVGTALVQNAQPCAEAWDRAARTDPRIRRALMMLISTSTWGELLAVHMPILMAMSVTMFPAVKESVQKINRPPGQPPDYESPTVIRDNGRMPG